MEVKLDAENILLTHKHTQPDPMGEIRPGQALAGKVSRVADGGAYVALSSGLEAYVRQGELAEDANRTPQWPDVGQDVTGKVLRVDPRERRVEISIRRYDREQERQMLKRYAGQNQEPLTLGDVLVDRDEAEGESSG
jgi:ribosomal protein S1